MKTIFDTETRVELINRINTLTENNTAQWGKMNIYQMLKHCTQWEEMALGKKKYKQSLLGRLFGKMALKDFIKDQTPFKRNVPTVPGLKIKEESGDLELQRKNWINLIQEYAEFSNFDFIHTFFSEK